MSETWRMLPYDVILYGGRILIQSHDPVCAVQRLVDRISRKSWKKSKFPFSFIYLEYFILLKIGMFKYMNYIFYLILIYFNNYL